MNDKLDPFLALEAFLDSLEDEDLRDELELSRPGPMNSAQIEAIESALGVGLPESLRDFMHAFGQTESKYFGDGWNTLWIATPWRMLIAPQGLIDHIDKSWGGRPELAEAFDSAEIAELNRRYKVFGTRCIDSNVFDYLFFDRDGGFHSLLLDQDDMGDCIAWLEAALETHPSGATFANLMTDQVSILKRSILDSF
jgi:hypothetical protein